MKAMTLRFIFDIIKFYKWKSIFFYYMKSIFILLFVPVFVLTAITLSFYTSSTKDSFIAQNTQSTLKAKNSVENFLTEINKVNYIITNNQNVAAAVLNSKENLQTEEAIRQRHYVRNVINDCLKFYDIIDFIYIYSTQSDYVISDHRDSPLENFSDTAWYSDAYLSIDSPHVRISKINSVNYITFIYPLSYSDVTDGLIIQNIRLNKLNDYIASNKTENFYLLDNNDAILYSDNYEKINNNYIKTGLPKPGSGCSEIADGKIYCCYNISDYPLSLVSENIIPKSMQGTTLALITFLIFLLSLILTVVLAAVLSVKFYSDISDIAISLGLSSYTEKTGISSNEFQFIKKNILYYTENLEHIKTELYEKSNKLKTSQQIALQMQITPHFILNTLNTVNLLLLNSDNVDNAAVEINSLLAELLQNILNTSQYIIDIEQEIKYTKKYLQIENYKSSSSYNIIWETDDSLMHCKTVKFILQPILENAIFHGLKCSEKKEKTLKISVMREENDIAFIIEDNGKGMSEEMMNKLNSQSVYNSLPQNKHLGFSNVNLRIWLTFGSDYSCKVIKSNQDGTAVKINIPYQT